MLKSEAAVDVTADYGPLILGGLLAFGLSGCVSMQFVVYWQNGPGERWATKLLVIVTWLLDLCHTAFIAVAIWDSIIAPYGDPYSVDIIPWSVGPTIELTAIVTFLVQSFFAHRLYKLQKQKFTIAGPVFALAFVRLVAASVSTAEMIKLKHYAAFVRPFPSWIFTLGLSLSAFVDIVIMTFLGYFLRSNRSRIQSTNRTIDTLTFWAVQNGSITCLAAIASLVCWLVMPENRVFLGIHFVIAKLYANSLLATLNARTKFRRSWKFSTNDVVPAPITVVAAGSEAFEPCSEDEPSVLRNSRRYSTHLDAYQLQPVDLTRSQSIEVKVQRTVESKYDDEPDVDGLSMTAETLREMDEPQAL